MKSRCCDWESSKFEMPHSHDGAKNNELAQLPARALLIFLRSDCLSYGRTAPAGVRPLNPNQGGVAATWAPI